MRILAVTGALLALTLLIPATGQAADPPKKEGSFGTRKATGAILTREQLRACMAQQAQVAQQDDALPREKAALAAAYAEFTRSGEALKEKLNTLDRTNAEAVAAYNDEAQARDRQIEEHEARVTAFNARVELANAARDVFVKGCGNRRFFEDDEVAIKKGR